MSAIKRIDRDATGEVIVPVEGYDDFVLTIGHIDRRTMRPLAYRFATLMPDLPKESDSEWTEEQIADALGVNVEALSKMSFELVECCEDIVIAGVKSVKDFGGDNKELIEAMTDGDVIGVAVRILAFNQLDSESKKKYSARLVSKTSSDDGVEEPKTSSKQHGATTARIAEIQDNRSSEDVAILSELPTVDAKEVDLGSDMDRKRTA